MRRPKTRMVAVSALWAGAVVAAPSGGAEEPSQSPSQTLTGRAQNRLAHADFAAAESLARQAWQEARESAMAGKPDFASRAWAAAVFEQLRGHELTAERGLREAQRVAAPVHRTAAGILLGTLLLRQGQPLAARHVLEPLAVAAFSTPDARFGAQLLHLLAEAQELTGEWSDAEQTLRRKLALPADGPVRDAIEANGLLSFCGTLEGWGTQPASTELAAFFQRTSRPALAERELREATQRSASLEQRAAFVLGLMVFLTERDRMDEARALLAQSRTTAQEASLSKLESERNAGLELRMALASFAGNRLRDRALERELYREALEAHRAAGRRNFLLAWTYAGLLAREDGPASTRHTAEGQAWMDWARDPLPKPPPAAPAATPPQPPAPQQDAREEPPALEQFQRELGEQTKESAPSFFARQRQELAAWEAHSPISVLEFYRQHRPQEARRIAREHMSQRRLLDIAKSDDDSTDPKLLARQLRLLEQLEGPHSENVLNLVAELAEALDKQWPLAEKQWQRAAALARRLYGEHHPRTAHIAEEYADAARWAANADEDDEEPSVPAPAPPPAARRR